ncbi:MAG: hypothetical protein K2N83_03195, partial [Eubacterium sp.]|nr:hypothetical protein [Eubacterium sp.]
KIENCSAYILQEILEIIWNAKINASELSETTVIKYKELMESLNNDANHIKCYEITNAYIVEEGFNRVSD